MKALHLVKTSDGSRWAMEQARELVKFGNQVAVVLPSKNGKMVDAWQNSGVKIYYANVELPVKKPWMIESSKRSLLEIVEDFGPDLVHSHFFSTTILARMALGKSKVPVVFQVPGPLHLENALFRNWDIQSARPNDIWIASSHAIRKLYLAASVTPDRVAMSYYGNKLQDYQLDGNDLRKSLGLGLDDYLVGNISYFYPPKKYLFQKMGLKGHELAFDCLGEIGEKYTDVKGVFWGGQWGAGNGYEKKLRGMLPQNCQMPGMLEPFKVSQGWQSMDLCMHLPYSENCGGVIEPLMHGVPVLASNIGGLPEIIIDKKTGLLVEREQESVVKALLWARNNKEAMKEMAQAGGKLVRLAFDVERTASEINDIYHDRANALPKNQFQPGDFIEGL